MKGVLNGLLLVLAKATDRELAKHVEFLKAENGILRSKLPKRITVTAKERQRLVKLGKQLGSAANQLVTIVSPRTFARWMSGETKPTSKKSERKPGRPRTADEIREVVLKFAQENGWGSCRILGEMKKLGVTLSRTTVRAILKEQGLDPGPKRGEGTWSDFVKQHASTLWACDFFSKKIWTTSGLVEFFVLLFINVGSRRVHIAGMTAHPDKPWMIQQARNVSMYFAELPEKPTILLRDYDGKFVREFDDILAGDGIEVKKVGPHAPNLNAFAERFVQSIRSECLDHFIVFGEEHLRYLCSQYLTHYLAERPHQGIGNVPLSHGPPVELVATLSVDDIVCDERLGGLLKHYRRKAA